MPDGVLPALSVVAIIGESFHDELVDAVQRDALVLGASNRHRDQRDVRIRRLLVEAGSRQEGDRIRIDLDRRAGGKHRVGERSFLYRTQIGQQPALMLFWIVQSQGSSAIWPTVGSRRRPPGAAV